VLPNLTKKLATYFALADIMVSFPPSDGMPQSLYEAMACQAFPILSDLPQYYELIRDGINGRLVPAGNVAGLAEAMRWAVDHPMERKGMVEYNRKLVAEIADKKTQDAMVNAIYDELCVSGGRTSNSKSCLCRGNQTASTVEREVPLPEQCP